MRESAPVVDPFVDFKHDIQCEARNCPHHATVMVKGCNDTRHWSICKRHLAVKRADFASKTGSNCNGCNRRWIDFKLHYDTIPILIPRSR